MGTNTVNNAHIATFESIVRHLAQQSQTKLRTHVTERTMQSNAHNWERLGPGTDTALVDTLKAERTDTTPVATPVAGLPWSRRVSVAQTHHTGELVEQEDIVQTLIDPNSNVAQNIAMTLRRQQDRLLIEAATGDAQVQAGGPGNGYTTSSFPAGQGVGDGTTPISFDMVTEVQELFMQNNIDPDVPKVFVVGPTQVRKLMQLTEQTSKDYVRQGLDQLSQYGIVPSWMGFTWIMSTLLQSPGAGELYGLAFTKRALGLHIARDLTVRVAEDPSASFGWRLYAYWTMGAARVEDEHIVRVHVLDALA